MQRAELAAQRKFAFKVVKTLREAGFQALWAGGCVRDALLNRTPGDYDVATSAKPDDVRSVFGRKRTLAVGESFGVIVVLGPKEAGPVEVATFRSDGEYADGRRPDSVVFSTPEEDALRRDFTINGMFFDPIENRVIDYVNGQRDIQARVIRAIGEPIDRMTEDKLRTLRAVRFAATLNFEIESETAAAIRAMAPQLNAVSAERIAQELRKMLAGPRPGLAVRLADQMKLLPVIFPELRELANQPDYELTLRALHNSRGSFEIAMSILCRRLSVSVCEEICDRLRLSNKEQSQIVWLVDNSDLVCKAPALSKADLKTFLVHEYSSALLTQSRAILESQNESLAAVEFVESYRANNSADVIDPPHILTGADLIALGLKPGPQFKELLDLVRTAQLNETIATRDDALQLIRPHIQ